MLSVKKTKIAYAKLCDKYFTTKHTTSDHNVEPNTSLVVCEEIIFNSCFDFDFCVKELEESLRSLAHFKILSSFAFKN